MSDELIVRARRAATSPNYWPSHDISDILTDLCTRLDRAEARAAEWKAMAERLAEQMRETVEEFYGEDGFTYNPDETEALAAFDALVARDADEEGGT